MTDFEREEFEQEKTVVQMQLEHTQKLKEMELEIARLDTKWTVVLRLPLAIIMIPVKIVLAFGYIVGLITKQDNSKLLEYLWKN